MQYNFSACLTAIFHYYTIAVVYYFGGTLFSYFDSVLFWWYTFLVILSIKKIFNSKLVFFNSFLYARVRVPLYNMRLANLPTKSQPTYLPIYIGISSFGMNFFSFKIKFFIFIFNQLKIF